MKTKLLVLTMTLMSISVAGQQSMFKALFIFNFAKYIEWPGLQSQSAFIIGVYGSDDIVDELNKLAAARKINNHDIVVKRVENPDDAPNANIFYIPESKTKKITEVVNFFNGRPTLIITDYPKSCEQGAGINYILVDNKMKFEISTKNIASHNLNINPKLVSLGIKVE